MQGMEATRHSPEYVQLSTAAAITLGLQPGAMYRTDCTHCLNLLLTYEDGCRANCSYCGLARHRERERPYADRNFIRVDWPTARFDDVVERVGRGDDKGAFQRMCISMITHPGSTEHTLLLLEKWVRALPRIPVSILSNPTTLKHGDLVAMRNAGADIFTVALDAATPGIFERTRGRTVGGPHRWEGYWLALEWAAEVFGPRQFGAHLICGMGETEREFLAQCQRVLDMEGHTHLFAFFPETGSAMEDRPPVDPGQWRRVQLARYLMEYRGIRLDDMAFDEAGRVADFGVTAMEVETTIEQGTAFRTSGCPGPDAPDLSACNRPYGDSGPTDIRSFPFAPDARDIAVVRRQMAGERVRTGEGRLPD